MPFGLINAPFPFQCLMNDVFGFYLRSLCCCSLIISWSTIELWRALGSSKVCFGGSPATSTLCQLDLSSCFAAERWDIFGCISREIVKSDARKIKTMLQWPSPTSLKSLRGFLEPNRVLQKVHQRVWLHCYHLAKGCIQPYGCQGCYALHAAGIQVT